MYEKIQRGSELKTWRMALAFSRIAVTLTFVGGGAMVDLAIPVRLRLND